MSFEDGLIDLRSDTVTRPTPAMRAAMASAEVGDDVFDDDPTVHRLQERAAALTGHAAALFVASGTMGNLVALLTHCGRGAEVIVGDRSHIYLLQWGHASLSVETVSVRAWPVAKALRAEVIVGDRSHIYLLQWGHASLSVETGSDGKESRVNTTWLQWGHASLSVETPGLPRPAISGRFAGVCESLRLLTESAFSKSGGATLRPTAYIIGGRRERLKRRAAPARAPH